MSLEDTLNGNPCQESQIGCVAKRPLHDLNQHQALALLNRWVKLKGYWYYDDRDALYATKDEFIQKWVRSGDMSATRIIKRGSIVFSGMEQAIADGGAALSHLNWGCHSWDACIKDAEDYKHWHTLCDFTNDCITAPLTPDRLAQAKADYASALAAYEASKLDYAAAMEVYPQQLDEFKAYFNTHRLAIKQALLDYTPGGTPTSPKKIRRRKLLNAEIVSVLQTMENPLTTIKQVGRVLTLVGKLKLQVEELSAVSIPVKPQASTKPSQPKLDSRNYTVEEYAKEFPDYQNQLNAAVEWARGVLANPDLTIEQIDEDMICTELEQYVDEIALDVLRDLALDIFKQALDGKFTAQQLHDKLTDLPLEYEEAIGMKSYTDYSWGETSHGYFGKWHEINMSATGLWLVEFQSNLDPSVTFHIPYDRAKQLKMSVRNLPEDYSDTPHYGREITIAEQREYPIVGLLAILGQTPDDYPYGLQNYTKSRHGYRSYKCWDDDEDYITEFDEDEWMQAGY